MNHALFVQAGDIGALKALLAAARVARAEAATVVFSFKFFLARCSSFFFWFLASPDTNDLRMRIARTESASVVGVHTPILAST
jgi:hypothetical protein